MVSIENGHATLLSTPPTSLTDIIISGKAPPAGVHLREVGAREEAQLSGICAGAQHGVPLEGLDRYPVQKLKLPEHRGDMEVEEAVNTTKMRCCRSMMKTVRHLIFPSFESFISVSSINVSNK